MKQDSLQQLLDKFCEGTLNDAERTELERLSHKEEVFSAARGRASGILRRRVALAVSTLMIFGAGVWAVLPGGGQMDQMAQLENALPSTQSAGTPETVAPKAVEEPAPLVAEAREVKKPAATTRKAYPAEAAPTAKPADEPVVVCNNQCDADSVISDIRKFLAYEGM